MKPWYLAAQDNIDSARASIDRLSKIADELEREVEESDRSACIIDRSRLLDAAASDALDILEPARKRARLAQDAV